MSSLFEESGLKKLLEQFALSKAHLLQSPDRKWIDFRGAPHGSKGVSRFFKTPAIKAQCAFFVLGLTHDMAAFPHEAKTMLLVRTAATALLLPAVHQLFWKNFDRHLPVPDNLAIDRSGGATESLLPAKEVMTHFYQNAAAAVVYGGVACLPAMFAAVGVEMVHPDIVAEATKYVPSLSMTVLTACSEVVTSNMFFNAAWCGLAGWMLDHNKWTISGPVAETKQETAAAGAALPALNGQKFSENVSDLPSSRFSLPKAHSRKPVALQVYDRG